jgi:hypothetical protein
MSVTIWIFINRGAFKTIVAKLFRIRTSQIILVRILKFYFFYPKTDQADRTNLGDVIDRSIKTFDRSKCF